ncbi:hypothetical protein IKF15_02480 [Candidatus Saccharibacteria bacterium]|nr:hypothetical protein [Candidatus Saccharibacteria bacterium]
MTKHINEKIEELQEGAEWFYGDEFKLEEASGRYKKLVKLANEVEGDLEKLKNEIEVIGKDFSQS